MSSGDITPLLVHLTIKISLWVTLDFVYIWSLYKDSLDQPWKALQKRNLRPHSFINTDDFNSVI